MDIWAIVQHKKEGLSDRETAKKLGVDRKTVRAHWKIYLQKQKELMEETDPRKRAEIQDSITGITKRKVSRNKTVCTPDAYQCVEDILHYEKEKNEMLGNHKQKLTMKQIHGIMVDNGFTIGYTSVKTIVRELRNQIPECYILQDHPLGKRLEYDFGEAKLIVGGKKKRVYLAVFGAPASKYRQVFIYENANLEVFIDSHVNFFAKVGGVWQEVVYDNMKNVVAQFKRNEKVLNEEAVKLAMYYGFNVVTTNVRSGNEKGFVEGSVNYTRNQLFAKRYIFESMEEVRQYVQTEMDKLNADSKIHDELMELTMAPPPYQRYELRTCHVDHCSMVRIMKHAYSVPDQYVNQDMTARIYLERIELYDKYDNHVGTYKKNTEPGKTVDIRHYLRTLKKKPGALCDSYALRSNPKLKLAYDTYYTKKPKEFIRMIEQHIWYDDDALAKLLFELGEQNAGSYDTDESYDDLPKKAYIITHKYNKLIIDGEYETNED